MKNKKIKVAINGFGRIGRQIFRINHEMGSPLQIVAVNNLSDNKTCAHLLKYDSNYGKMKADIKVKGNDKIIVDGMEISYLQIKEPENLPWEKMKVDLVIESTGAFTDKIGASKHLKAGAKKVLISAPGKDADATLVMGVNEDKYDSKKHDIISNGSCTTNCMAPIIKIINDAIGINYGLMTTIHSYTNDQRVLDLEHKDMRRARAAGLNMIPTTTGAAKTVTEVIPELKGKLNGISIRVPTPVVSLLDLSLLTKKNTSIEEVNLLLKKASKGKMKKILAFCEEPLVSTDFKQNTHSAIIDGLSTDVMQNKMVKIIAWYDNEWGYSTRTVEMAKMIADKI